MPVTLLTDLAETKLATAAGSGSQVAVTHIALGDANGVAYDPAANVIALRNERVRRAIDSTAFQGGNTWIVKAEFPADTPPFDVREIGFFDQDGDLIAIWAGIDVDPRQTGVIVYLVEHALSFARVANGVIIVDAPPDNEIYPGQMVTAKSGQTWPGWLECDGSVFDEALYPYLVPYADVAYSAPDSIDLGVNGMLILPVEVTINGVARHFYFWSANHSGSTSGSSRTGLELNAILNGGAEITEAIADREAVLNGTTVRLPILGDPDYVEGGVLTSSVRPGTSISSPQQNQTHYDGMYAIWDAFNGDTTASAVLGIPPGWLGGNYWSATKASPTARATMALNGYRSSADPSVAIRTVALEVINPPQVPIYTLPDSAALGVSPGYSYYIRHGGL